MDLKERLNRLTSISKLTRTQPSPEEEGEGRGRSEAEAGPASRTEKDLPEESDRSYRTTG